LLTEEQRRLSVCCGIGFSRAEGGGLQPYSADPQRQRKNTSKCTVGTKKIHLKTGKVFPVMKMDGLGCLMNDEVERIW
jgi:hypothetical protein